MYQVKLTRSWERRNGYTYHDRYLVEWSKLLPKIFIFPTQCHQGMDPGERACESTCGQEFTADYLYPFDKIPEEYQRNWSNISSQHYNNFYKRFDRVASQMTLKGSHLLDSCSLSPYALHTRHTPKGESQSLGTRVYLKEIGGNSALYTRLETGEVCFSSNLQHFQPIKREIEGAVPRIKGDIFVLNPNSQSWSKVSGAFPVRVKEEPISLSASTWKTDPPSPYKVAASVGSSSTSLALPDVLEMYPIQGLHDIEVRDQDSKGQWVTKSFHVGVQHTPEDDEQLPEGHGICTWDIFRFDPRIEVPASINSKRAVSAHRRLWNAARGNNLRSLLFSTPSKASSSKGSDSKQMDQKKS